MNVELGTIEWIIGALLTGGAGVITYLFRSDRQQSKDLSEFKTHVAGNYVPRPEVNEMIASVKQQIRDSAEDIKDFIEAKIKS